MIFLGGGGPRPLPKELRDCAIYPLSSLLLVTHYTLHPTESHNTWQICTNLPSSGQYQLCVLNQRSILDKDVFCLDPNRTWRQNSLGRVAPYLSSLSVNLSSVLFSSSVFSISFSTSMSIVCRISHQYIPCNGMGRNTNCHCHTLHTASGCHPHSYCMRH